MSNILSFLLSSLLLYKYWALLSVFFLSGLILPLPTSTVLLATGAFASQGYFNFFIALAIIVGANMIGDYAGYFIAQKYGKRSFVLMRVNIPAWIERLEKFLRKHPRSAIFITRFVGTTDILTNLLCGFSGVPISTFLLYDFFGNLLSDGSLLYIGYFLGIHWQDFTGIFNISDYILLGIVVAVILSVIIWNRRRHHPRISN